MPVIKARPNWVKRVRMACRLTEPNRDTLQSYARFIHDSPDYVLNQLIETVLARDRDFLAWRTQQAAGAPVGPTERIEVNER